MGHNGVIKGSDGGNVKVTNNAEFPKEWTIVSLERDCVLISGLRPKGGASDEGIPSLGGEHITLDGRINFSDVNAKYIPEKFFKIMTKGKAEENDILINKDGANTGKVAILKKKFYKDIAINEHLFILRSKKLFVQQYLFYWLFSRFGQKQITDRITGSAQPGLSSTFIKNFLVPRPPLPEQRKIAEILETIDNAIEKTDAIIEKYKRIKQGLMQDLLTKGIDENGKIRNEKTHKFKDSPIGRIPEKWEVVRLMEVVSSYAGGTPNRDIDEFYNGNIKWLKSGEISKKYISDTEEKITEKGLKFSNAKYIAVNAVVIALYGATAGQVGIVKDILTANQAVLALNILDKLRLFHEYLYYFLSKFIPMILSQLQGSGQPNLSKNIVDNTFISLPPSSRTTTHSFSFISNR